MDSILASIVSRESSWRSAALAAGIADHARAAAGQRDGDVPESLQARQRDQRHHMPDMQAVGSRVKAVINRHRAAVPASPARFP